MSTTHHVVTFAALSFFPFPLFSSRDASKEKEAQAEETGEKVSFASDFLLPCVKFSPYCLD